jgi:hypothetical protein
VPEHQLGYPDVNAIGEQPTRAFVTRVVPVPIELPELGAIDTSPGFERVVSWPVAKSRSDSKPP